MRQSSLLICIAISILFSTSTYAFDGERKGFILGGGLGVGYLSNTTSPNFLSDTKSRLAFQTNFKIGYAPSNTLEIFYSNKVSWWDRNGLYLLGLGAAAFTLYFDNTSETGWFVSGGIGFSSLAEINFDNSHSGSVFGLFSGAGYEFSKHWTVEVDLLYSNVTVKDNDFDFFGVLVTINVLAF
ncbi:MAG: porin family protein [Ignavibacteriaceae bacterium]|nr:porin family protein [Ignavibacteriaceae bacterium]